MGAGGVGVLDEKEETGSWPDTIVGYGRLKEKPESEDEKMETTSRPPSDTSERDLLGGDVKKNEELSFFEQGFDCGFGHGKRT